VFTFSLPTASSSLSVSNGNVPKGSFSLPITVNVRSQAEGTLRQTDEEYAACRARASLFNATARTADGYLGLLFRRPPFIKVPEGANGLGMAMRAFINDAEPLGTSLATRSRNRGMGTVSIFRAACAKSRWSSNLLVRAVRGDEQRVEPEQRRDMLLVLRQVLVERRDTWQRHGR
jgi:hypothetical protein